MPKKIFSVGIKIPGGEVELLSFRSDQSLLDTDIIVFSPNFLREYLTYENYQEKPLLSDFDSFKVKENINHWHSELKTAYETGKTIFVFLSKREEVYCYTGGQDVSGTGRNRLTTKMVDLLDNYKVFPFDFARVVSKSGTEIRISQDLSFLSSYWNDFNEYSSYQVYLEGTFSRVLLTTKTGERTVGATMTNQKGNLVLLPIIDTTDEDFYTEDQEEWSKEGITFGKKLTSTLVQIDKTLRSNKDSTPTPEWTTVANYRLGTEDVYESKINSINQKIEKLQFTRANLLKKTENEGNIRKLLFESGSQLEGAILESLRIIGFTAENYRGDESEFDAIFCSEEGRFLGEAEGKDSKPINIDKLSQLERNIQEDFSRDEVNEFAKGVLFGNAYRLVPLAERQVFSRQNALVALNV